jgi:protein subunit release factor A
VSLYKIDSVMDGDIDEFIDALTAAANAERLKNL